MPIRPLENVNCRVSLPWFAFRNRDDTLSRLRREAYAVQADRHPVSSRRHFTKAIGWPFKAVRTAWKVTAIWGAEARACGAPSRLAQCAAISWLALRHNLNFQLYYLHKLWRSRPGIDLSDWMDAWDSLLIFELFSNRDEMSTLNDKLDFDGFCKQHDLPHLPILAVATAGGGIDWLNGNRHLPAADIFVKPADGAVGRDAMVFAYDESAGCWQSNGQALSEDDLLAATSSRAEDADLLIQRRAINHPQLAELSPDALCTLRCVTYRFADESARHFRSAMHMARSGAIVDHGIHGAVFAAVDDDGFFQSVRDRHVDGSLERHPDTGARIAGGRLPCYREMQKLACRAHDALGIPGLIGWDVALLPDGPVIVEGNSRANLGFTQLAMDHPLGKSEYVSIVARLAAEASESPAPYPGNPADSFHA